MANRKKLTERDICTKFIAPAIEQAGWDKMVQIREEVFFTKGPIIVPGSLVARGKAKRADYILSYKPNIPLAIIEAKDNNHSLASSFDRCGRPDLVLISVRAPVGPAKNQPFGSLQRTNDLLNG